VGAVSSLVGMDLMGGREYFGCKELLHTVVGLGWDHRVLVLLYRISKFKYECCSVAQLLNWADLHAQVTRKQLSWSDGCRGPSSGGVRRYGKGKGVRVSVCQSVTKWFGCWTTSLAEHGRARERRLGQRGEGEGEGRVIGRYTRLAWLGLANPASQVHINPSVPTAANNNNNTHNHHRPFTHLTETLTHTYIHNGLLLPAAAGKCTRSNGGLMRSFRSESPDADSLSAVTSRPMARSSRSRASSRP
jgi:hypothetical protein